MKTVLKVALGVILAAVVLIGGCAALIGAGIEGAKDESDKTAITVEQYGSAKTGSSTRDQIEADFGTPKSSQDMQADGVEGIPASDFSQSCIYYGRKGNLASVFQFCFDGSGTLQSKASY